MKTYLMYCFNLVLFCHSESPAIAWLARNLRMLVVAESFVDFSYRQNDKILAQLRIIQSQKHHKQNPNYIATPIA